MGELLESVGRGVATLGACAVVYGGAVAIVHYQEPILWAINAPARWIDDLLPGDGPFSEAPSPDPGNAGMPGETQQRLILESGHTANVGSVALNLQWSHQ